MWVAFANAKGTHIFSAKILAYMTFNGQSFNHTLTNNIVSFEQLGQIKVENEMAYQASPCFFNPGAL